MINAITISFSWQRIRCIQNSNWLSYLSQQGLRLALADPRVLPPQRGHGGVDEVALQRDQALLGQFSYDGFQPAGRRADRFGQRPDLRVIVVRSKGYRVD